MHVNIPAEVRSHDGTSLPSPHDHSQFAFPLSIIREASDLVADNHTPLTYHQHVQRLSHVITALHSHVLKAASEAYEHGGNLHKLSR